jgi:hypothetical protein
MELLSLLINKAGFNKLLVDVESYISWHSRCVPFYGIVNRLANGPSDNYLFELEAQPGGS